MILMETIKELSGVELLIGYGGVRFFSEVELKQIHLEYMKEDEGDWKPSWVVFGVEESLGDPIFFDKDEPGCPVYTAFHGEGTWEPICIAPSILTLLEVIHLLKRYSIGRRFPVAIEKNPLSIEDINKLKI